MNNSFPNLELIVAAETLLLLSVVAYCLTIKRRQRSLVRRYRTLSEKSAIRQLALELHDNIGPLLLLTRIQLDQLLRQHDNTPEHDDRRRYNHTTIENCIGNINNIFSETMQLAGKLRESRLAQKGVVAATEELLHHLQESKKINTSLIHSKSTLPLRKEQEQQVFRIIQEAVQNVIKHAKATELSIRFSVRSDCTDVHIVDNGKGFDNRFVKTGSGLLHMRERAALLSGRLTLSTQPDAGTCIHLQIPKS